jgi:hypothetical protein
MPSKHAEHALEVLQKWTKPDGVSDADFTKQKTQFGAIMESVAGFSALQLKDYASAQKHLRTAVETDPSNVENVYALAVCLCCLPRLLADEVNGLCSLLPAQSNLITDPTGKAAGHRSSGAVNTCAITAETMDGPICWHKPRLLRCHRRASRSSPLPLRPSKLMPWRLRPSPTKMDFGQPGNSSSRTAPRLTRITVWNAIKGKAVYSCRVRSSRRQPRRFDIAGQPRRYRGQEGGHYADLCRTSCWRR